MSKVEELQQKFDKAVERVAKKKATIERHKKTHAKYIAKLQKYGVDTNNLSALRYDEDARKAYKRASGSDLYWDICDAEHKEQDIEDSIKKLAELERIANDWKVKLDKAKVTDDVFCRKIPEALKDYEQYLIDEWDKFDKKRRQSIRKTLKEIGYAEFMKKHTLADYNFRLKTDKEIHRDNCRDARDLVLDLYRRVYEHTGEVTNWSHLNISLGHINGTVEGVNGKVVVESILAGGWHIQRLHTRTLVKPVNE